MQVEKSPMTNVGDLKNAPEDGTMSEIRTRYAPGYEIDAELVAREILRKIRLIKWARQELVSEPSRTPGRSARGR
jgi:hypothetical protein